MTQDTGRSWVETAVAGLVSDIRILIRQELLLARHEVQYEAGKIIKAALLCGIAVALAGVGLCVVAAASVQSFSSTQGCLLGPVPRSSVSFSWLGHGGSWQQAAESQSLFACPLNEP